MKINPESWPSNAIAAARVVSCDGAGYSSERIHFLYKDSQVNAHLLKGVEIIYHPSRDVPRILEEELSTLTSLIQGQQKFLLDMLATETHKNKVLVQKLEKLMDILEISYSQQSLKEYVQGMIDENR